MLSKSAHWPAGSLSICDLHHRSTGPGFSPKLPRARSPAATPGLLTGCWHGTHWSTHRSKVSQGKEKQKQSLRNSRWVKGSLNEMSSIWQSPPVLTQISKLPSQRSSTLGGRRVTSYLPLQHSGDCPDDSMSPQMHSEPSRCLATGQEAKHSSGNTGNSDYIPGIVFNSCLGSNTGTLYLERWCNLRPWSCSRLDRTESWSPSVQLHLLWAGSALDISGMLLPAWQGTG